MSDIRKILNTLNEMTSGSVASVSMPLTTQRRDHVDEEDAKSTNPEVLEYGNWENSSLTTSKKLKQTRDKAKKLVKKIYGEAVAAESMDGVAPSTKMFTSEAATKTRNPVAKAAQRVAKGSGKHKNPAKSIPRKAKHKGRMYEEEIIEQDLIISPVIRRGRDRDLISRDHSRIDREVEMARGDIHQAQQNAAKILAMIQDRSEQEGLEGWVQEKIIKASDYLNTVREYLENKGQEQGVTEGHPDKDVLNRAVDLYRELSKKYSHKIAIQKAAESHNLDSVKLNSYIDHGRYSSKQDVTEGLSDPTRKVFFKVIKTQGTGMPSGYRRVKTITPLEDGGFYIELSTPGYGMNYTRHNYKNFSLTDGQGKPITGQEAYDIINGQQGVAEAGPFSYGSKAPRKGSVADLAAKKHKEQQKGKQPVEPKDQMVGVAKVITKGVAEGLEQDYLSQIPNLSWKPVSRSVWNTIQDEGLDEEQDTPSHSDWVMASLSIDAKDAQALMAFENDAIEDFNRFDIHLKSRYPGLTDLIDYDRGTVTIVKPINKQGVAEGSDQELVRRQLLYWDQVAKEKKEQEREARRAKKAEYEKTPADKAEKYWSQKGAAEDLDANQRRVGQLGPTEKIGKRGTRGRLVGGN